MTIDHAIDVLSDALKRLAEGGFVLSGEVAFIQPRTPSLIASEATFERSPVPRLVMRTVRREPVTSPPENPEMAAGFISGDVCPKCGGGRMQQAGACKVCLDCGESGGCG
jgi:hypothetical protein